MRTASAYSGDDPTSDESDGLRLLLVALAACVLFHGGLLPFTHGNTYDAFIHMFFADSYHRSWFDPWEPRWYTGFATTSYPPGSHMAIATLMKVMPLRAAFVVVQTVALVLLTIGTYRFARLCVTARPAGYAAISLVLASSISETVHLFGQLPTTLSLGIFLNGLPFVFRWIVEGRVFDLLAAVVFAAATTAAHHVTTIFGGVLFILPLGLHALSAVSASERKGHLRLIRRLGWPVGRGLLLAVLMLAAIVITVFPYWSWSINDPITQVPIPHGSRESFIARPDLGVVFFLLPWGTALLVLPYLVYKTVTTRHWPLGISVLLCFLLGTGGTTPLPRALLGGAFDILTLDRFTFWATILILPFTGLLFEGLLHGRAGETLRGLFGRQAHRILIGGYFLATVAVAVFAAILPSIQPTQPRFIDPAPIVQFLEEDEHDRWRYLTLGFGDQFAYLSAQTEALSVDGNYHSARRLPDMTRFSVERLENAKYLGVPGLGSLQQFLVNADSYNLKYVFSNDDFYDPLLHFSGWTRLNRLSNGVTVWEKADVTPLRSITPRREIPAVHMAMWAVLPPAALTLAALVSLLGLGRRPTVDHALESDNASPRSPHVIGLLVAATILSVVGGTAAAGWSIYSGQAQPETPEEVIEGYFDDLDFRRFEAAYARLDPETRPDFEVVMFNWRWRGGLLASYGKLASISVSPRDTSETLGTWEVTLEWLTSLGLRTERVEVSTVFRGGAWRIAPMSLRPNQTPARLQRGNEVTWNVTGRRQPRIETDLHRDRLDRPRVALHGMRLVERGGRYSLVGAVTNADADPAMTSLFGELFAGELRQARTAAGQVIEQRLLPAETAGFRVDFEGVLSLEDAADSFDPTLFIPPEFDARPDNARIEARALVTGSDLYRGVALNAVRVTPTDDGSVLSGLAVNTGTETATIIRVIALLYDKGGAPVWAEAGYAETNIYPGQSAPFTMKLPAREAITIVSDLGLADTVVNGSTQQADTDLPEASIGTIPLSIEGYSALRLQVSTMTFDPLF
ncbi:hypothetical protein J3R80_07085 [Aliiroseovarius sp. Z3]|uniref:hypothetical protein n=1 Tax=Aliiroseovarius sp. Z3 TaxID=2811402 RepID=UPI0023B2810E|nr:hypothetical protein [Aliiroseovarius sp. Z3]MDE9450233.1 hypothetical protein [Aliiroseovarius sp. Z3]